ncbi:MAG: peptidoglycan-binding protein [Saprospiraceae bacterium]|nr:peptidoglycan-binding protein [Saprospiraceae bacterium]
MFFNKIKGCWLSALLGSYLLFLGFNAEVEILNGQVRYLDFLENELIYYTDHESNRIPDYSYAGYQGGTIDLPEYPVVRSIDPIEGDNTDHIQQALDELALLPLNSSGIRGTLLLNPGTYTIRGQLKIEGDGMVLRGTMSSDGSQHETLILGEGNEPEERDLITLGGRSDASWRNDLSSTRYQIINSFLPVGSRTLQLASIDGLEIGDKVIVRHPSTDAWLSTIDYGATATDDPWQVGNLDMYLNRTIVDVFVNDHKVVLDAPIYDHFDRALSDPIMYKWDDRNIVRESGIEDLEIRIETGGAEREDHVRTAIHVKGAINCWVQNIEASHFAYAAVNVSVGNQITIKDCQGLEPHAPVEGGWRYNFAVNRYANNVLFINCEASYGRHAYVCNGASFASGIVFHNVLATHDQTSSEGHRRWSQGLLFDNFVIDSPDTERVLALYNRGSFGTGHGWSAVHSTAWNVSVPTGSSMVLQKPPGRQNYAFGVHGNVTRFGPFAHPGGYQHMINQGPEPSSLYQAQLLSRMQNGALPDAPAKLRLQTLGESFVLKWLDVSAEEDQYIVELRHADSAEFQELVQLPANQDSFLLSSQGIAEGSTMRVYALQDGRSSPYSNIVEVEQSTAVVEISSESVSVFPNPIRNSIIVQASHRIASVSIYTLDGGLLQQQHFLGRTKVAEMQLQHLLPGVYMAYVMLANGAIHSEKLLRL